MKYSAAPDATEPAALGATTIARLLGHIRTARAELDRFNRLDLPAYDEWMSARFGTLLGAVRELRARADEIQDNLDRIDGLAFEENLPHHRAYARLFDNYIGPEWFAEDTGLRLSDLEADDGSPEDEGDDDPYHDQLAEAFAELMGPYADPDEETAVIAAREERMRICYRQLARRLHPDHRQSGDGGPWIELWHQAQEAYNQGDVARLEVLLTLTEMESGELAMPNGRDEAAALIRKLRHTLAHLSQQIEAGTAHDAWNFASRTDRAPLELSFEREKLRERLTLERRVLALERKLRRWSRPPRIGPPQASRPSFSVSARARLGAWIQLEFPFVKDLDRLHPLHLN
ncbi:MAG TPA: hypothetical protein PLU30_03490 [Verrucomicrobiae bacterium]|nr:hypothetical protein [Verrucomicrobiae bacterium]